MTIVYYYIPEDRDELAVPNAFVIPKNLDDITLDDVEEYFSLKGEFIFRFKYKYQGKSVWLDLSNRQCKVPKYEEKIIMKVTRKVPKYPVEPEENPSVVKEASKDPNLEQYFQGPSGTSQQPGSSLLDF